MRQAIVTKFIGPTDHRGSRVKATAAAGSITVNWSYNLNTDQNHTHAARKLVEKLGWTRENAEGYAGIWKGGGLPDESGNVYVFAEASERIEMTDYSFNA